MPKPVLVALALAGAGLSWSASASAMPNFARKLNVPCSTCHTTIPRLNETGYKFRAAGFRMPDDIGKDEKPFNLGDYFAGRIQARYDASKTTTGAVSSHRSQLRFHELTVYPTTGSFAKYFSSLVEVSLAPDASPEIENGYARADYGSAERFFEGRVGIFHPFEGFGASDRPIAISRPYFQTTAANAGQSTFFTTWGFDQMGAEGGVEAGRASLRAMVFNGLTLVQEDGAFNAKAAQGGDLSKPAGLDSSNTVDFQAFGNYILHDDGGGVSAHYYHGNLDLPVGSTGSFFQNTFDRIAVYAGYPVVPRLLLLGAFQHGRDHLATGGTFTSRGYFAEADVTLHEFATAGFRYDWFDPARTIDNDELRGLFGFLNMPFQNGLQVIAEYQNKRTRRGLLPDRKDNIFQVRFILIE